MTVQDEVEKALMSKVAEDPNIDVRFDTEAIDLTQDADGTRLTLRNTKTGEEESVVAAYTVGADGPGSSRGFEVSSELVARSARLDRRGSR